MLMQCPTCDHTLTVTLVWRAEHHTASGTGQCTTCRAVYAVEVRELRASELGSDELESRRNRISVNGKGNHE